MKARSTEGDPLTPTRTLAAMNFGVRLPGPFRVGISSTGRLNAGVTMGPLSVSTNVGGRRTTDGRLFLPVTLDQATHAITAEGWTVTYRDATEVHAEHGWQGRVIESHPRGVTVRAGWSTRKTNMVSIAVIATIAALALWVTIAVA